MRLANRLTLLAALVPVVCRALAPEADSWYLWTEDGVRHYVVEVGRGEPVVVLHGGWGAEHGYLLRLVEPLADRFRFVLYDQRGSLRSPAPDGSISLGRLVADLEELRDELGLERMTLLAHSMGSMLAYAYLREHPERVRSMVMLAPVVPPDAATDAERVRAAQARFVEFARAQEKAQAVREGLDHEPRNDRERSARSRISMAAGNLYHVERWRQLEGGQAFYNPRVHALLQENTPAGEWQGLFAALATHAPPVELILGDHDLVDFGVVAWPPLAAVLPNARLHVVERAGHNAWIDQPEAVRALIARALADGAVGVREPAGSDGAE